MHIKKASEKTAELSKYLNGPDSELEERLGSLSEQEKNQMKRVFFNFPLDYLDNIHSLKGIFLFVPQKIRWM